MAEDTLSSEFYWDNIVFKVEDKLFCVPRCEFVQSSEVFADMFLLPSGTAAYNEGQDREHPIVLEGYKKDEFTCLVKVMYPRAGSLISGTNFDLRLEKEEWISVLKLSTIWNMAKIRNYAIHRMSTDVALSPVEKILLARAHKVAAWLDEGINSLTSGDFKPQLESLTTLGWETAARILWIRDNYNSNHFLTASNTLRFRADAVKCGQCSSSASLINGSQSCNNCRAAITAETEITFSGPGSVSGTGDRLVPLRAIQCKCGGMAFYSIHCSSCAVTSIYNYNHNVRIAPNKKEMIEEMFGEEIKDYKLPMTVA